jgi:hypothetical protein
MLAREVDCRHHVRRIRAAGDQGRPFVVHGIEDLTALVVPTIIRAGSPVPGTSVSGPLRHSCRS